VKISIKFVGSKQSKIQNYITMSFISSIVAKLIGTKAEKDIKQVLPMVKEIKEAYERIKDFDHDALRAETLKIKQEIRDYVSDEQKEIDELKEKVENTRSASVKEGYYDRIDKLEKIIEEKLEEALKNALPTAFAIVKSTAQRFFDNTEIEVTATDFDRNLATTRDLVDIKGEKAIYYNSWTAGGNKITWDMVHYDVQLIGGIVLHSGKIAEMATGEGKTLVATLPVFLNALTGRGVHLVTVNDYLAKRDAEWMGPIFEFHGLSVDCIDKHDPNSSERRAAYECDITYGTNNEFGFDYLRDNMAHRPQDLVQRKHNYAIVDEVDSVLIDDARTPLIISGPVPKGDDQMFNDYKANVQRLFNAQKKFVTDIFAEAKKLIANKDTEKGGLLLLRAFKGLPKNKAIIKFLSEEGMKALLQKTENYYMQENGKHMHKVTDDLFFVIDEKLNSIELTDKGIDLLSTDAEDASFFVLPDIGSELADLEKSVTDQEALIKEKDKMLQDYAVKSERVHTINQLLKAYAMFEKDVEYVLMDNKVKIVDEQTGRIMEGRRYSDGLHQAIEAKENVKVEAATQTFATVTLQNYFRMYGKLSGMTGTAETEAGELWNIYKLDVVVIPTNKPIVRDDRQDLVFKTKREKYNKVIEEIIELQKEGRPSLVGTTSVEVSEILSRMLKMRGVKHNVLNAKLHQREAEVVAEAGHAGAVTIATNMAGRGTDIKLIKEVKKAGGLAIIATERHESRRVDRQLRGRAGRQGDPGSSQFYVSLEDDLMRLFGSDRIAKMMDRMGIKEGEVIQHSMITKSIERAQRKVEENNFGIRKRLLEYDDVMNSQREVIYSKRRHALFGERLGVDIANMMFDVCEAIVENNYGQADYDSFKLDLIRHLSIEPPFDKDEFMKEQPDELTDKLFKEIQNAFERKELTISQQVMPVIGNVYKTQREKYENIVIPISDGTKVFQVVVNLEKAYKTNGEEVIRALEKYITLAVIDETWKEHLREMDDLKTSVQNASYEQKDPLLIYKFESFELFRGVIDKVNKDVSSVLLKSFIPLKADDEVQRAQQQRTDYSKYETSRRNDLIANTKEKERPQPLRVEKKVGRNDPCPCGSGKKFKQCHGRNQQEE
jgi:preprotein translocase subunit SecA